MAREQNLEGLTEEEGLNSIELFFQTEQPSEAGEIALAEIIERLIDVSAIGVDLYAVATEDLKAIAHRNDVSPSLFWWDSIYEIVEALRPVLRSASSRGNADAISSPAPG